MLFGEVCELLFELFFEFVCLGIDDFGKCNLLFSGLVKVVKVINVVGFEFCVEVEVEVEGVVLNFFDKKVIVIKG